MSSKRRKLVVIISIISAFSILFGTVVATAAWSEGGISELWNSLTNKDGVVKYEKPSVGEIAQDGAYPEEIEPKLKICSQCGSEAGMNEIKCSKCGGILEDYSKEWYEYITYSKTSIGEVQDGNQKIVFYDPYDYNYGMIMKISNPENDFGEYYDGEEGYTTANEISVSYSVSNSHSWSSDISIELGFEEELEEAISAFGNGIKFKQKFSQSIGTSHTQSGSDDSSASKEVTYNALYFNSNGTPYNWRVVKYTVYLPLYCEAQTLVNGEWVVTETNYYMITTVEGTCREWINNVAYIEDWRTGEPVQVEDFWGEFLDEEDLKKAYEEKLLPEN